MMTNVKIIGADVKQAWEIDRFEEVGSTNDLAQQYLANISNAAPRWFVTPYQFSGRGRRGREWEAVPGNFAASLALEIEYQVGFMRELSILSLVIGVAVQRALSQLITGAIIQLKWPNDILVNNAKICGILIEASPITSQNSHLLRHRFVIGCGINIVSSPNIPNYETAYLKQFNPTIEFDLVLHAVCSEIKNYIEKWVAGNSNHIIDEWKRYSFGKGTSFSTTIDGKKQIVSYIDVSETGALIIQDSCGKLHELLVGDITFSPNKGHIS